MVVKVAGPVHLWEKVLQSVSLLHLLLQSLRLAALSLSSGAT